MKKCNLNIYEAHNFLYIDTLDWMLYETLQQEIERANNLQK